MYNGGTKPVGCLIILFVNRTCPSYHSLLHTCTVVKLSQVIEGPQHVLLLNTWRLLTITTPPFHVLLVFKPFFFVGKTPNQSKAKQRRIHTPPFHNLTVIYIFLIFFLIPLNFAFIFFISNYFSKSLFFAFFLSSLNIKKMSIHLIFFYN